jgi:methylation protein EvaC
MDFGPMPLGNGFLEPKDFAREFFYSMRLGFCPESKMVQLMEQPAPEQMFHGHYPFFTGTSAGMRRHFETFGSEIRERYLHGPDPFIVEIGSNDGTFLRPLATAGIRHLGIEPSHNVAEAARARGVQCISRFFSPELARETANEQGHADAITAANVICHIPDFNGVLAGVAHLLKPGGVFVFEEPYLGDVVTKVSYDQFYDEHVFMFSALSVSYAAKLQGLELIRADPQPTHGGSMRYTLCRRAERPVHVSVADTLAREKELGLDQLETFVRFRGRCEESRDNLRAVLDDLRARKVKVVGYAATSKSTTVVQYCGITPEHIAYICDTTPIKQGKFSPGAHIPVVPHEVFQADPPPYALLFAWNHAEEIMAKEANYSGRGGKWIRYVPEVMVS